MDARKRVAEMTLRELLRFKMLDYGYTSVCDFADMLGVSWQHMFKLLAGQFSAIGIETRRAIVQRLDVSPDVLSQAIFNEWEE